MQTLCRAKFAIHFTLSPPARAFLVRGFRINDLHRVGLKLAFGLECIGNFHASQICAPKLCKSLILNTWPPCTIFAIA
jgi:hypothetical protein